MKNKDTFIYLQLAEKTIDKLFLLLKNVTSRRHLKGQIISRQHIFRDWYRPKSLSYIQSVIFFNETMFTIDHNLSIIIEF